MVDSIGPGINIREALLPEAIIREAVLNPFGSVAERARRKLEAAIPALAPHVVNLPFSVFGLTGGFFYVTSAQGRAWGMQESLAKEVLAAQALGHFHFAFQDLVIDEALAPPMMCMLSDVCLLLYLEGLATIMPRPAKSYHELHREYYNIYAAAVSRDLAHRERLHPYTPDELLGLGDKAAPGGTMLHLVADLAGHQECAETAVSALLRLCTGLQLLDDLHDCVDDISVGNMTWPVTSALLAYPDLDQTDNGAVMAAVVGSGAARSSLRLAVHAFTDALELARHADASVLADLAQSWNMRTQHRAQQLDELLGSAGVPA